MQLNEHDVVSVVIPTYNRAELLRETVDSILAQTRPADEIVIVDDGSTDHTASVCMKFAPPVRCIRQENTGLPGARNTGILAARGNWICLCDSDDLWTPDKLSRQIDAVKLSGAGWSITEFNLIDPDGNPASGVVRGFSDYRAFSVFTEKLITPEDHLGLWLERRELAMTSGPTVIYEGDAFGLLFEGNIALPSTAMIGRAVLDKAGLFDESFRVAEETEFFHRIAAHARVAVVMEPLAYYRVGHASIVSSSAVTLIRNAIRSIEMAKRLRPEMSEKEWRAYHSGRRRLGTRLAYEYLSALESRGARQALRELWRDEHFLSPRGISILVASFLPGSALRSLHRAKRALVGIMS